MSLILGIDPGSRVTGYGIIRTDGKNNSYVTSGCIRSTPRAPFAERLLEIGTGLAQIIVDNLPDEAAVEKVFMAKNASSALKLGQARGAAILAVMQHNVPVSEYEARKVKQAVVGTGAADKTQVQHMVRLLLGLSANPQEDAADALAIAICHAHSSQGLASLHATDGDTRTYGRGRIRNV